MKKRIDLITSKAYWVDFISSSIWNNSKVLPGDCEIIAKKIVDKYFMDLIKEIKKYKVK